jgi:hypothetical protein
MDVNCARKDNKTVLLPRPAAVRPSMRGVEVPIK